jgi:hypothetical protein
MMLHKPEPNIIGRENSKNVTWVAAKAMLSPRPSRVKLSGTSTAISEEVGRAGLPGGGWSSSSAVGGAR